MPLAFSMNSGGVLAWKLFLNELVFFEFLEMIIIRLELVSKELNHLAAILHVYAGGSNFKK